jgi:cobalt/nickel transport system permease protein
MAGSLDARVKLASALAAIILVSSTPAGAWTAFGAYALILGVAITGLRIPPRALFSRILLGAPFVAMTGLVLLFAGDWPRALTVTLKGFLALAILAALTESTAVSSLIWAIRKLGAPPAVNMIAALMLRYIAMLNEEFGRMSRARLARAGGPLAGVALFEVHGNQAGLLLVRSWERAERIHQAMLARGFTGAMPCLDQTAIGPRDIASGGTFVLALAAVRLLLA